MNTQTLKLNQIKPSKNNPEKILMKNQLKV